MPKITEAMKTRNKLIVADYKKDYHPDKKKSAMFKRLAEKYDLSDTAIARIVEHKSQAITTLNKLKRIKTV